jgi:hypothetical protein
MDMWEALEQGAALVLEREVSRKPIDRHALERALHVFAIGKNRDPQMLVPVLDLIDNATLVGFVNALLSGNKVGV